MRKKTLLRTKIKLQCLITKREAMLAENQQRIQLDQPIAFNSKHFIDLGI